MVAAELAETTKLYARCAAAIDPAWLERIAGKLCKRHYFDPHWEKQRAQAMAFERITLYGLTIVPKRRIAYGPIDPAHAREIFIRQALVAGEYESTAPFLQHNQQLIDEIRELESKVRRQDILVDEQQIFEFYAARIPAGIYSGTAFEKWRKQAEQTEPELLYLTREVLIRQAVDGTAAEQFRDPDSSRPRIAPELPFRSWPSTGWGDRYGTATAAQSDHAVSLRPAGAGAHSGKDRLVRENAAQAGALSRYSGTAIRYPVSGMAG